jgi:hypothetical protein
MFGEAAFCGPPEACGKGAGLAGISEQAVLRGSGRARARGWLLLLAMHTLRRGGGSMSWRCGGAGRMVGGVFEAASYDRVRFGPDWGLQARQPT